jgi:glycogen debranching enzyme
MERAASEAESTAAGRGGRAEHVRLGDEYYVLASSLASRRRKHVLAHGDTFAVIDQSGDVPATVEEELGLFYRGTRHLSQLEMLAGGVPPFFLSARVTPDGVRGVANLTNGDLDLDGLVVPRSTVSIRRTTLLCGPRLLVRLVVHSFSGEPLRLPLELRFGADFRDIFEVRGVQRLHRGDAAPPAREDAALVFSYLGRDGVRRLTRCTIGGAEPRWIGTRAILDLDFAPQEERTIEVRVDCLHDGRGADAPLGFQAAATVRARDHRAWEVERTASSRPKRASRVCSPRR